MQPGFSVDPESIRRSAGEIRAAADELMSHVDTFVQGLSAAGEPWGFDTLGLLIGGGYAAVEQVAITTFDSIVDSLDDYADRLGIMAESFEWTEADNTGSLADLEGEF